MNEIKYYKGKNGKIMAVVVPAEYRNDGINFITGDGEYQQIAFMGHKAGHIIVPHFHNKVNRNVDYTCETLIIRSGQLEVTLYEDKIEIHKFIIKTGDVITLISGGHGFKMIENCDMIEIKQGPYVGEQDKTRF